MTNDPQSGKTLALVERLREMVRREQQFVAEGRLEELVTALAGRQELMASLPPRGELSAAEVEALEAVRCEGEQTLVCLRAIREELATALGAEARTRRATGGYGRASRL